MVSTKLTWPEMVGSDILNYKIESVLGEGGMGTVYLASHIKLGRKAAIKELLPEFARDQQIVERFLNEVKTLSLLNHQNIVTLYDFADIENKLLLIMEYIEGTPLDVVIEKITGAIPEPRCIKIFEQVLAGFSYAHRKGIVHRDIKPSNIILQPDDTPKILDFGIAKIVEGDVRLTRTGTRMGSVVYMSPEQVMGRDVDYRSDIYSLGVTLFEMLSGKLPYDTTTESEFDIQNKIVREPLKPVRALDPGVSEHLENIIYRATSKEPSQRFQSCDEFSNALSGGVHVSKPDFQTTVYQTPQFSPQTRIQTGIAPAQKTRGPAYLMGGTGLLVALVLIIFFLTDRNSQPIVEKKTSTNGQQTSSGTNPKSFEEIAEENVVKEKVNEIISAWENKDIDKFFSNLTSDYFYESTGGITRTFRERKNKAYEIFANNSYIKIEISNLDINVQGDRAVAKYYQKYRSSTLNENTSKTLYLRKENGRWLLYKELSGF